MGYAHSLIEVSPITSFIIVFVILVTVAIFVNFVVKRILVRIITKYVRKKKELWGKPLNDKLLVKIIKRVIPRIANTIPVLVIVIGTSFAPEIPIVINIKKIVFAIFVFTIALALISAVETIAEWLILDSKADPLIKGYSDILRIAIGFITVILIIAILIDKSPLFLFSGLGAVLAIIILLFQDTILSFVASVNLSLNNMINKGDLIEIPSSNILGTVTDIALHTIKIENFDESITTIPTRKLVHESFKNWKNIEDNKRRSIQRSLYIDPKSIHFLTDSEKLDLKKIKLLHAHLDKLDNNNNSDEFLEITNLSLFQIYAYEYLKKLQEQDMSNALKALSKAPHKKILAPGTNILIRQLETNFYGLPIEIYCFTATKDRQVHEVIQSDIFSHLYAMLQKFQLEVYHNNNVVPSLTSP